MSSPKRMEDLKCKSWLPLTEEELTKLNPIGLKKGSVTVDRYLLSKLLGERDRLHCVLEASLWLIEEFIQAGFIEADHLKVQEPDDLERAIFSLRNAIQSCRK
jgi:hypothetical protein